MPSRKSSECSSDQLPLGLACECAVEFGQRRGIDGLLGLAQRHRRAGLQRREDRVHLGVEIVGRVDRTDQAGRRVRLTPGSRSASSAIRIALVRPIDAATNADAPPSGISPILVNANRKYAFSDARMMSAAIASETPTPAAGPCTTDDDGLGQRRRSRGRRGSPRPARRLGCRWRPGSAWSASLMPAPELNPRPAPPIRTTRTAGSVGRALQCVGDGRRASPPSAS